MTRPRVTIEQLRTILMVAAVSLGAVQGVIAPDHAPVWLRAAIAIANTLAGGTALGAHLALSGSADGPSSS